MIPVLLFLGFVLGRWWRTTIAVAMVAWPALLVVEGVMNVEPALLVASALAVANVGVGVILQWAVVWAWRSLRTVVGSA